MRFWALPNGGKSALLHPLTGYRKVVSMPPLVEAAFAFAALAGDFLRAERFRFLYGAASEITCRHDDGQPKFHAWE
jgi:hypothetical protein